ncbi:hypothetical protein HQ584_05510, partial [Patescibacteria group bacterium]|nr:hypothetical protein [Patescibacteria group bacterium]
MKQNISRKDIRRIIWSYLKGNSETQTTNIIGALRAEIAPEEMKESSQSAVEEIYSMLSKGIIVFGESSSFPSTPNAWPYITVTEYGKKCLDAESLMPLDPDGYLNKVREMVPSIDRITLKYLSESINAFNRHAPISATIALGITSEQLVLLLIEAYIDALKNVKEKKNLVAKTKNRFIETQYAEFKKSFESHRRNIEKEAVRDIDAWLESTFRFIKMLRNEQGHPTDLEADRDTIDVDLQHFPHYMRRMY